MLGDAAIEVIATTQNKDYITADIAGYAWRRLSLQRRRQKFHTLYTLLHIVERYVTVEPHSAIAIIIT